MRHFGMQRGGGISRDSSLPALLKEMNSKNEGGERRVQASSSIGGCLGKSQGPNPKAIGEGGKVMFHEHPAVAL